MADRYKIIRTNIHNEWLSTCPIKIEKSQIVLDTKENTLVMQVRMFNLIDKMIKSVFLNIEAFDVSKKMIQRKTDVAFLAVNALGHTTFGDRIPVSLDSLQTANVTIVINKVIFENDEIWSNINEDLGIELPAQALIDYNDALYNQIEREFLGTKFKFDYWYESHNEYWRCTCGQANDKHSLKCGYCGADKEWLEKHLDRNYLEEQLYIFNEVRKKREKDEIAKKIQEEDRINTHNKIKRKKLILRIKIAAIIFSLFIISLIMNRTIIQPNIKYNNAIKLYESGNYNESVELFENLNGFKDSELKILAIKEDIKQTILSRKYEKAKILYSQGNYEEAILIFEELGEFGDTEKLLREAEEKKDALDKQYILAKRSFNTGKYKNAKEIFVNINGYKDSEQYLFTIDFLEPLQGSWVNVSSDKSGLRIIGTTITYIFSDSDGLHNFRDKLEVMDEEVVTGISKHQNVFIENDKLIIKTVFDTGNVDISTYRKGDIK